jgi:hypothetical protein
MQVLHPKKRRAVITHVVSSLTYGAVGAHDADNDTKCVSMRVDGGRLHHQLHHDKVFGQFGLLNIFCLVACLLISYLGSPLLGHTVN